jgi:signal transduction histidine kinase
MEQFLARCERSSAAVVPLKLLGKGAEVLLFSAYIAAFHWEGEKRLLLQLHDWPLAAVENKATGLDGSLAHKQKLDCALQLARTVALDFNNALTSILGHASLVLTKMEPGHPSRSSLVEIEKAAEKAAEVANQLAAFSRAEKDAHGQAAANLNVVLRRVVEVFQRSHSGLTWSLDLESRIYSAKFDEAKVQQAIVKILENAVEAMGDRGQIVVASRNLDVAALTHDGTVQLEPGSYVYSEITDTGRGIEPEVLPRIFDPFFTTKQGHRGLGLAWVYGIITNHGGGVAVSSQSMQGASVRIYLPATRKIFLEGAIGTEDLRGQETILMVDDEDLVLNMGRTILAAFGYQVLTASSGTKALEILSTSKSPINLVITDLVMPQMSGRELIGKIRDLSPGLPILCTSGYVRATGNENPATFLQKPFTSQDLLRRVKQLLTASEAT